MDNYKTRLLENRLASAWETMDRMKRERDNTDKIVELQNLYISGLYEELEEERKNPTTYLKENPEFIVDEYDDEDEEEEEED